MFAPRRGARPFGLGRWILRPLRGRVVLPSFTGVFAGAATLGYRLPALRAGGTAFAAAQEQLLADGDGGEQVSARAATGNGDEGFGWRGAGHNKQIRHINWEAKRMSVCDVVRGRHNRPVRADRNLNPIEIVQMIFWLREQKKLKRDSLIAVITLANPFVLYSPDGIRTFYFRFQRCPQQLHNRGTWHTCFDSRKSFSRESLRVNRVLIARAFVEP